MAHFSTTAAALGFLFLSTVSAQNVGTLTPETHPKLTTQTCTKGSGCVDASTAITLDSNWRWTHSTEGATNCYTGNTWDAKLCPDGATCASACAIDGADYPGTYGIASTDTAVTIKFVTPGASGGNIGSRVYLMADDENYQMFKLKNQEFTFDVDVSNLPCGINGAVYFVEMDQDGGMAKNPGNKAGAKYGTGYCDAQCASDIKWINGEANVDGWVPSETDVNGGTGKFGTCCAEMDIWEANSMSTALTPHPCSVTGQTRCEGADCGHGTDRYNGVCDLDGCDLAPYRTGNTTFYGEGKTVDTKTKMTVVTQFLTVDGTAEGALKEIRRLYIQNDKVIQNSKVSVPGIPETTDSITSEFCTAQKTAFGDTDSFATLGGMSAIGDALGRGMVLALSLWADHAAQMLWLDSNYPVDGDATKPGVARGSCATSSGVAADVQAATPDASVTHSNIKIGDIDSTYALAYPTVA